jgi:hypothetical protein
VPDDQARKVEREMTEALARLFGPDRVNEPEPAWFDADSTALVKQ